MKIKLFTSVGTEIEYKDIEEFTRIDDEGTISFLYNGREITTNLKYLCIGDGI